MWKTLFIFLMLVTPCFAGQVPNAEHIYVASQAVLKAVPDIATAEIIITNTDIDVSKSKADVDDRCAKVIGLTDKLGIQRKDITAGRLSIEPDYEFRNDEKIYKGTTVSRVVTIVLRDLSKYNDLIQKLVEVPISMLKNVTMSSTQIEKLQNEAIVKAIEKAKLKAKMIAKEFGVDVGDVYSVSETKLSENDIRISAFSSGFVPMSKSPVFEPGTIDIESEIYVIFTLKTKK